MGVGHNGAECAGEFGWHGGFGDFLLAEFLGMRKLVLLDWERGCWDLGGFIYM